jgi:hypothetical protein
MQPRPDLQVKQVAASPGRWCASGHVAVESWSREGPGTPLVPTLFYQVTSVVDRKVNGTYCELCLTVANAMARENKKR